jgi:hypothetical protein
MKQTAVEWFVKELFKKIDYIQVDPKLIEQAIAMEKEQIELAFDEGSECEYQYHINGDYRKEASTYYKETYGGDKQP